MRMCTIVDLIQFIPLNIISFNCQMFRSFIIFAIYYFIHYHTRFPFFIILLLLLRLQLLLLLLSIFVQKSQKLCKGAWSYGHRPTRHVHKWHNDNWNSSNDDIADYDINSDFVCRVLPNFVKCFCAINFLTFSLSILCWWFWF